jgi:hypothetical protein
MVLNSTHNWAVPLRCSKENRKKGKLKSWRAAYKDCMDIIA